MLSKFTPILVVEKIQPCLSFWQKQLGFELTTQVDHNGQLGFVILKKGETEVMLQTRSSLLADLPAAASFRDVLLYGDVKSLDEIERQFTKDDIVFPRRKTFYGAQEIWVREPSGCLVGFAQF